MEAVIATGGKQYRVSPGQLISVERLAGTAGTAVEFRAILMVSHDGEVITAPDRLRTACVSGEIIAQGRAAKVSVVKFRRRKNYRRNRGHRQPATRVRIVKIEV